MKRLLFGVVIGFIGLALVIFNTGGWMIALGVWMMLWGNNIEQDARRR